MAFESKPLCKHVLAAINPGLRLYLAATASIMAWYGIGSPLCISGFGVGVAVGFGIAITITSGVCVGLGVAVGLLVGVGALVGDTAWVAVLVGSSIGVSEAVWVGLTFGLGSSMPDQQMQQAMGINNIKIGILILLEGIVIASLY
jgi:hypothetical protein